MGRGLPRGRGVGALSRRLEAPLAQAQEMAEPIEPGPATTLGPVLALLLAALSFSLMTVCVKGAGHRLPVAEVVLARALVSLSWWMLRRLAINPWGRRRRLLALRGLLGSVALACVYGAVMRLPLATATLLQYLYPTFTALLAWLSLGEQLSRRLLLGCGCGWLGVLVVAQGTNPAMADLSLWQLLPQPLAWSGSPALIGLLLGLLGALLTALAYVSVRELGRSEHPLVIVFWFPLMSLPLSLPWVLHDPVRPSAIELLWLLGAVHPARPARPHPWPHPAAGSPSHDHRLCPGGVCSVLGLAAVRGGHRHHNGARRPADPGCRPVEPLMVPVTTT